MAGTSVVYDVAVIGAGVTGSAAAYQIAKRVAKVVLLEQVWNSCSNRIATPYSIGPRIYGEEEGVN